MFIKFKNAFINLDHIAAIAGPHEAHPEGALVYANGNSLDLEPGEYDALASVLLAASSINLAAVASDTAAETYRAAGATATFLHFQQTQEMVRRFRSSFFPEISEIDETATVKSPSQSMKPQVSEFKDPASSTFAGRPGLFPDPFEEV